MPDRVSITDFIKRWELSGAAERANYQVFLYELCDVLGVERPNPTQPDEQFNAYVFERNVTFQNPDGTTSPKFIDLYKRNCFVLEAKQGSERASSVEGKGITEPEALLALPPPKKKKGTAVRGTKSWDDAMLKALGQAELYAKALPVSEGWPVFLITADIGHSFELYADFTRAGKTYLPFPDAQSHRLKLADLQREDVQERLKLIWTDPLALDPSRRSARVTREVANKLALLAKSLEHSGHTPKAVAEFLMRCLFTMFAEDVGLIPKGKFTELLEGRREKLNTFKPMLEALWQTMNTGGFSTIFEEHILHFNGGLFENCEALPINRDQLELLIKAGRSDWREVEPAIFGTLLERALNPIERHKLGAHYTPREYVERLVLPTVIEPLREEWKNVLAAAVLLAQEGKIKEAAAEVQIFHRRLCELRVLDPACGSGNFLYVTLEHLKRLEGDVINALNDFDSRQAAFEIEGFTVDPHQLLGLEINPRAAAIADLVLWIGYLQWHFRTRGEAKPIEPVLRKFRNIENRDAVLAYDSVETVTGSNGQPVTSWDGRTTKKHPVTGEEVPDETARVLLYEYVNARKAEWPTADYVVGNPPFIGNKRMRAALGDGYAETLRRVYSNIPESAEFVMYWWDKAAELARHGQLKRFGLIATNSLRQTFNRRVLQRHFDGKPPLALRFAIPDHPWVDSADGAAVRISMTVGAAGEAEGVLQKVIAEGVSSPTERERAADASRDDSIEIELSTQRGVIFADLTIGANVSSAVALRSNSGLCGQGVKLVGDGFFVGGEIEEGKPSPITKKSVIQRYISPQDILKGRKGRLVIDFFELTMQQAREVHPIAFQQVLDRVKPLRDENDRKSIRELWWRFAWERPVLRRAKFGLPRYFVTLETAKHRFFVAVDGDCLWDGSLFAVACDDYFIFGVLSSKVHTMWSLAAGGTLEDRPRYNNSRCFDPFPFPDCTAVQQSHIRALGEQLDAHRKRQQALYPDLTLTEMYNVLEKERTGVPLTDKERVTHEHGLIALLRQLHDELDAAVTAAYGWPVDLPDKEILQLLVALNTVRAREERTGLIRWLRPEYQTPAGVQTTLNIDGSDDEAIPAAPSKTVKLAWPQTLPEQAAALRNALNIETGIVTAEQLAKNFSRARTETVKSLLQTLVSLGLAREVEEGRFAI